MTEQEAQVEVDFGDGDNVAAPSKSSQSLSEVTTENSPTLAVHAQAAQFGYTLSSTEAAYIAEAAIVASGLLEEPRVVGAAPSDTDRETLAGIIQDVGEYVPGSHAADYVNPYTAADAILAAGFSRASQPVEVTDREPQPSDGPDFHAEHAFWQSHQPAATGTDLQAELAKVGLPENASLADLIQHHRANAGVAAALDSLRTSQPVQVEVTDEMVHQAYRGWRTAQRGGPVQPGEYEATFSRVEFAWMRAALTAALGDGDHE